MNDNVDVTNKELSDKMSTELKLLLDFFGESMRLLLVKELCKQLDKATKPAEPEPSTYEWSQPALNVEIIEPDELFNSYLEARSLLLELIDLDPYTPRVDLIFIIKELQEKAQNLIEREPKP